MKIFGFNVPFTSTVNRQVIENEKSLVDSIQSVLDQVKINQKVIIDIRSPKGSFAQTLTFGSREIKAFSPQDLKFHFTLKSDLEESETKSIVYNVFQTYIGELQETYSTIKKGNSTSLTRVSMTEDEAAALPKELNEPDALRFFKVVDKYSVDSEQKLLSPGVAQEIRSLVENKMDSLTSLKAPQTFEQKVTGNILPSWFYGIEHALPVRTYIVGVE